MLISYRLVKVEGEESFVELVVIVIISNSDVGSLVIMQESYIELKSDFVELDSFNEDVGIKMSDEKI